MIKQKEGHPYLKNNLFINNARLKLAKIKQKLSTILRLNFCYLKIVHFPYPCYHPKLIHDIRKYAEKTSVAVLIRLYDSLQCVAYTKKRVQQMYYVAYTKKRVLQMYYALLLY